eukprot:CAMPEP_0116103198 /NCGR_PEP_ID=MMETSP0327-20121206/13755_1 /TAXON_ID=44447 /ORGANISM="Pseudo-nitzschia delicatissima, Strain B596" /LENGTH=481 /DNA_ID=CAMNT_0003595289 /DNA_START=98 /DNA_END=1543 /DNA_ORIENTATION=+
MKKSSKRKNYPKKALSAYNIFFKKTREKILIEHGKTNFQEMVRKIAALWKEITHAEKVRFEAIAARDSARYNDEVKDYEQRIVEENETNKRQKSIENYVFDPTSVPNFQNHRETERDTHPIGNERILDIPRGNIIAGWGQQMPNRSNVNPTLTHDELELAMRERMIDASCLDTGGRRLSNASTSSNMSGGGRILSPSEMRLGRGNTFGIGVLGGDRTGPSRDALVGALGMHRFRGSPVNVEKESAMKKSTASLGHTATASDHDASRKRLRFDRVGLSTSNRIESRPKFGRGADSTAASKSGNNFALAFKEEEVLSLVNEAKMRFGVNAVTDVDRGKTKPPLSSENDSIHTETELQRRLNLRNQLARSNETHIRNPYMLNELNSGVHVASQDEMIRRMMAGGDLRPNGIEPRRCMSMEAPRYQRLSQNTEFQFALMQNQKLVEEKLGSTLEEIRLREERVSRRERMISQWMVSNPWKRPFNP